MGATLLRAGEIPKRPVVTTGGEDVAQVRDVVYDAASGEVIGFTLAGRGLLSGPMKKVLPWESVIGLGPHAVVVADEAALVPRGELRDPVDDREVLGARVVTDDGRHVGNVTDLVVAVRDDTADIVGYELEPSEAFRGSSSHILIPLPDAIAATGDNLVVPAGATEYVHDDLAGFGAAVEDFRARLGRGGSA